MSRVDLTNAILDGSSEHGAHIWSKSGLHFRNQAGEGDKSENFPFPPSFPPFRFLFLWAIIQIISPLPCIRTYDYDLCLESSRWGSRTRIQIRQGGGKQTQFPAQTASPSFAVNRHFPKIKILRPNFEQRARLLHNKIPDVSAYINYNLWNFVQI